MDDYVEAVQDLFRDVFGEDDLDITEETTASDVDGWDSLMHLDLIIALEARFRIKFATAEISSLKGEGENVGSLIRVIRSKEDADRQA